MLNTRSALVVATLLMVTATGCSKKQKDKVQSPADRQASRKSNRDSSRPVEVAAVDDQGRELDLTPVYFDYDSSAVSADYRDELEGVATWLGRSDGTRLTIEGHCDDRGTAEYNVALGERRAQSIRDYLQRLGVSKDRISIISYGEERPAAEGNGEEAWAKNRRGELRKP
jgi:peptidoglycan-associated lipoprotein